MDCAAISVVPTEVKEVGVVGNVYTKLGVLVLQDVRRRSQDEQSRIKRRSKLEEVGRMGLEEVGSGIERAAIAE
jgi:hypothetical protein